MEKIWLLIFAATMFCQFQLYKAADKIGKDVLLTKEEAEAKLKEMKEGAE